MVWAAIDRGGLLPPAPRTTPRRRPNPEAGLEAAQQLLNESLVLRMKAKTNAQAGRVPLYVPERPLATIAELAAAERRWMRSDELKRRYMYEPPPDPHLNHVIEQPKPPPPPRLPPPEKPRRQRTKQESFLEKHGVGAIDGDSRFGALAWRRAVCRPPPARGWLTDRPQTSKAFAARAPCRPPPPPTCSPLGLRSKELTARGRPCSASGLSYEDAVIHAAIEETSPAKRPWSADSNCAPWIPPG